MERNSKVTTFGVIAAIATIATILALGVVATSYSQHAFAAGHGKGLARACQNPKVAEHNKNCPSSNGVNTGSTQTNTNNGGNAAASKPSDTSKSS